MPGISTGHQWDPEHEVLQSYLLPDGIYPPFSTILI